MYIFISAHLWTRVPPCHRCTGVVRSSGVSRSHTVGTSVTALAGRGRCSTPSHTARLPGGHTAPPGPARHSVCQGDRTWRQSTGRRPRPEPGDPLRRDRNNKAFQIDSTSGVRSLSGLWWHYKKSFHLGCCCDWWRDWLVQKHAESSPPSPPPPFPHKKTLRTLICLSLFSR